MWKIEKLPASINLGNQIENDTKIIQIDVSAWNTLYPGCAYHITAMRPGDTGNWPVTGATHADGVLTWAVPNTVTSVPGQGSLVIHCTLDGKERNTGSLWYSVGPGHAAMGDAPDPVEDWIADATSKLAEVDHFIGETIEATESANAAAGLTNDAIDRANAISEMMEDIEPKWAAVDISVSALNEGAAPTASITQGETGTSISLGIPKGDTGAQGIQGEKGIQGDKGDTGAKIVTAAWSGNDLLLTLDDTSTVTLTGAKTTLKGDPGDISNIKVDGATKTKSAGVVDLTSDFARYALWHKTASGNPVSVYPVPESPLYPKVSGTFTQEGTGDPSPENIRPITPWLASGGTAKVTRTGKNLFNEYAYPFSSGYVNGNSGAPNASTSYKRTADHIPVSIYAGKTVTLNKGPGGNNPGIAFYDSGYVFLSGLANNGASAGTPRTFSIPSNAVYMRFTTEAEAVDIQIELGATATPYEPYTESEITLTAPQEIPAGWMDNEGNGQATWGKMVLNGTETWGLGRTGTEYWYYYMVLSVPGLPANTESSIYNTAKCSHYKLATIYGSNANGDTQGFSIVYGTELRFRFGTEDTVANWKAYHAAQYAAGTPVTVYYELATPIPITPAIAPLTALPQLDRITPRQNVLTASTGNIELTYAKSPIQESNEIRAAIALT